MSGSTVNTTGRDPSFATSAATCHKALAAIGQISRTRKLPGLQRIRNFWWKFLSDHTNFLSGGSKVYVLLQTSCADYTNYYRYIQGWEISPLIAVTVFFSP